MTSTSTGHDAIVVGGRIAGSLTAAYLAGQGLAVLVLESRRFPSDTISTHFFRGDGLVQALDDVGALEQVLATGAPRLTGEYFYLGGSEMPEQGPPQEPGAAGFCLSVRRRTLDAVLAARVADLPTVTFCTDTKVVEVLREGSGVVGVRDASGAEHRAPVVVGADGRRSSIARLVGAGTEQCVPAARVMYFRYVTGWTSPDGGTPDGPEFSLLGNELVYAFPCDGGATCVALSLALDQYGDATVAPAAYFEGRLREHRGLWPRFAAAQPLGGLFVGPPQDSLLRQAAGPGWALVGDAGTHQDPWSGFGMDTAARQARALAEQVGSGAGGWPERYARARDDVTLERFAMTASAAPDLARLAGPEE